MGFGVIVWHLMKEAMVRLLVGTITVSLKKPSFGSAMPGAFSIRPWRWLPHRPRKVRAVREGAKLCGCSVVQVRVGQWIRLVTLWRCPLLRCLAGLFGSAEQAQGVIVSIWLGRLSTK